MATVAKAYTTTIVAGLLAAASNVRRALDDIYDDYNGNIDTDNIAAGVLEGSSVGITDAGALFSSCEVEGALQEAAAMGGVSTEITQSYATVGQVGSACQIMAGHHLALDEFGCTATEVLALYLFQSASLTADENATYTLNNLNNVSGDAGLWGAGSDYAAMFDGATNYFSNGTLLDTMKTDFSMDFWFKTDEGQGAIQTLVNKVNTTNENFIHVGINATGSIFFSYEADNAGSQTIYSITNLNSGSSDWHHVAVGWDNTYGTRLWLDGVQEAQRNSSTAVMANGAADDFYIGAYNGASNFYEGRIAYLRVRQDIMTQQKVEAAMAVHTTLNSETTNISVFTPYVRVNGVAGDEQQRAFAGMELGRNTSTFKLFTKGMIFGSADLVQIVRG